MCIMKYLFTLPTGLFLIVFMACRHNHDIAKAKVSDLSREVTFYTADSIAVTGDLYEVHKEAAVILLFHQAGSNAKGEYGSIIPRLTAAGYNVLAIDQRSGGQLYGSYNRTVAHFSKHTYSYCDAYADLERALDFVIEQGFSGNKILWGSSYSAALVIQLANRRQDDVAAVLAFSPASGGPMQECRSELYFETLKLPMLLLRPEKEMEIESVKQQFDLALRYKHKTYVAANGVHGSSMLVEARTESDVKAHWDAVLSFIEKVENP